MQISRLVRPFAIVTAAAVATTRAAYAVVLAPPGSPVGIGGVDLLVNANVLAIVDVLLLTGLGLLLVAARRARWVVWALVAASLLAVAAAAGLEQIGSALTADHPAGRTAELSAAFMAMTGTGAALMPVPCVFAVGVVLAVVFALVRDLRIVRTSAASI